MREVIEGLGSRVAALRWLGENDWISVTPSGKPDRPLIIGTRDVRWSIPQSLEESVAAELLLLAHCRETEGDRVFLYLQAMKVLTEGLAQGIKLLRPTPEQCLAMQHVELSLSYADYRQPFPTMFVEMPAKYRQHVKDQFGAACHLPQYIGTWHTDKFTIIQGLRATLDADADPTYMGYSFVLQDAGENTVETAFQKCMVRMVENEKDRGFADAAGEIHANELCVRLALNMNLMMVNSKVFNAGPVSRQWEKKLRQKIERRHRPDDVAMLDAMPHVMEFEQNTTWHVEKSEPAESGDGTGSPKKPHWRRGHWRMQHYGEKNSKTRPVFIKPILVNGNLFDGTPSSTSTTYNARTLAV